MNEKSIFRKGTILDIVREHMRDCAGVSERDIDDHGERIAFRLQNAILLENDATVKACADAADRELESEVSAATRDAVSAAVNAVADAARGMKPNVRNERPEASAACAGSRSIEVLGSGGNHET